MKKININDLVKKFDIDNRFCVIDAKNADKVETALNDIQARTSARNIDPYVVAWGANTILEKFKIHKKDLNGCAFIVNYHAQVFPRAYKWTPESTFFKLEYVNNTWYLVNVWRDVCGKNEFSAILTETAKKAIIDGYTEF